METETWKQKGKYPCRPVTNEQLNYTIRQITNDNNDVYYTLRRVIVPISEDEIPWSSIHTLCSFGETNKNRDGLLIKSKLSAGFYVNHDGTWLILIHPERSMIQTYLNRCGKNLKSLMLFFSTLTSLDLSGHPSLERVFTKGNLALDRIIGLGELTALTELSLTQSYRLSQLPGLDKLAGLRELYLRNCWSLTQLPSLDNLKELLWMDLSGCTKLRRLPALDSLTRLRVLDLRGCSSLTVLPRLDNLRQLIRMNLYGCSSLEELPFLDQLIHLNYLSLYGCSSLTHLPPLKNLPQLGEVILSNCCNLSKLSVLDDLPCLSILDLSASGIRELPIEIRDLGSLRVLNLAGMKLHDLPDWLPEMAERFTFSVNIWTKGRNRAIVFLEDTTVDSIPDMSIFEQPYEMVAEWFRQRSLNQSRPLDEIKVVFLGDGEAGKSHTIARMMNDGGAPIDYVNVRTPGIVIKDKTYPIGGRDATLHIWDFGGQDIMHSMHRIFLTERTIYVVLVDGSIGNQDERARYWLQNIQSFAKDAPVLLVLNKLDDGLQADVNEVDLRNKFKGLTKIVKLSALQFSRERFNREFRDVLLEEIRKTGYLDAQWPGNWIQVKQALERMNTNYIRGGDYLRICREMNVDQNQKPLLQWFHDLGVSFCYCDGENEALEDYVVLKPNWITNALYIILFNEREGGNGGLVPIRTIQSMLSENAPNRDAIKRVLPDAYYPGYDVTYVLDVFHVFKLSFRKDERYEFFPMLADINAKPTANVYAQDPDCLEFRMVFDYLPPNNLLHRLMVERNGELDMDNVWRSGARFELKELGFSAVVVIDGNTLRFFIRHENPIHRPNTYLTMLKTNVDRIVEKMGLKVPSCQLIYKLDGKQDIFDYEMLKAMQEAGQTQAFSMTWRKMIPIESILNQSAPDGLKDEKLLLDAIIRSCQNIQGDPIYYYNGDGQKLEDQRNRRIRDDLHNWGYHILDQSQRGHSESGKSVGELDLLVYNEKREPWTVIEALRISDGSKTEWNRHLNKLINNYNYFGAHSMFLLTYVDADPVKFDRIWKDYCEHIRVYVPAQCSYSTADSTGLRDSDVSHYLKAIKRRYYREESSVTVYHIFVCIS